jgi:hypothetical protein
MSNHVESVTEYGCSVKLRTDCATENGVMAALQCEFRSSDPMFLQQPQLTRELSPGGHNSEEAGRHGG